MSTPHPSPSMIRDLRALPRSFWVLFAGTFINRFGTFVWPFLTIYLTRQGYSTTQAAWAISGFGAGAIFGSAIGGWLADHIGRRNTIMLGTFTTSVCVMLLYAATSLPLIVTSVFFVGLTSGIYGPACSALLADIVPNDLRVQAYSAFRLSHNAGFACGVSIGGVLATHSTFLLFAGDAASTTIFGVIAIFWLPHGLRAQTKNAPWRDAFAVLRKDYTFHALWAAVLAEALIFTQFGSTYSLHVFRLGLTFDRFGLHLTPESVYGLLLGWNGALVVLTELAVTSITLRFDARRVMALGYCLLGLGFGLNAWAHSIFALWLTMTIFTVGEMISAPTTSAFISRLAPERLRGRYMGVLSLAWNLSGICGPQLGFRLLTLGPNYLWFPIASLGFAAAVIVLTFTKSTRLANGNSTPAKQCEPVGVS